jgi:hypothetical protein
VIEHGTVTGNATRTHQPCGACGELVDLDEGCRHTNRSARSERREQQQVAMVARAELLGALGYPRP